MQSPASDLNQRIAARVRELRAARKLSLDALARISGVSRSMISLIERGESNPTAVALERLAAGLGVTLPTLFDEASPSSKIPTSPVARYDEQPQWQDPASGYLRRNVSPPSVPQPMQIVEVHFPAGAHVAFDHNSRDMRVYEQFWILEGTMEITFGKERHRLRAGDCLAMELEGPITFHNPTRKAARYALVMMSEPLRKR